MKTISVQKSQNLFVNCEKTNTQKIPIWNVYTNWENLCPNLSFLK